MTANTLRETIAARIVESAPALEEVVADRFVAVEISKRADSIVAGMEALAKLQRDRAKIARADAVTYNADRTIAAETYSKARLDEIEKLDKQIDKLTRALDKALGGDMGDLNNLNSSKPDAKAEGDGD